MPTKAPTNPTNTYNHNYEGRYCRCDQVYVPEREADVMHQCGLCEDWFHARCVGEVARVEAPSALVAAHMLTVPSSYIWCL